MYISDGLLQEFLIYSQKMSVWHYKRMVQILQVNQYLGESVLGEHYTNRSVLLDFCGTQVLCEILILGFVTLLNRKLVVTYANENKKLFLLLMKAITESLGLIHTKGDEFDILEELEDGSQLMVLNCYPPCPEPDLTFGMPPHSDYGFLTLLQQDDVAGFQIHFQEKWVTVQPVPNSFVITVGDHLEVYIYIHVTIIYSHRKQRPSMEICL